ncbi:MAG TPA: hypothetical protein EYG39_05245 [Rhodothermales bacterium]|nr:hypothetical protein [Rhodothermales bacterium]
MASLLNRDGTYYASFKDSSRRPSQKRHSLKTKSKRTATRLLSRLDDAYALGEWDPWTGVPSDVLSAGRVRAPKRVREATDLYLNHAESALKPVTYATRRRLLRRFVEAVGERTLVSRVAVREVEAFVRSGGVKPSTQGARLIALKALFSYWVREGFVKDSPAHVARRPNPAPKLPRAISDEELNAVLKAIPPARAWTRPVFEFAALTGLRVSELARLQWSDVDEEARLLRIERQKNGRAETQPLPTPALTVLQSLPKRGSYVFGSPRERLEKRSVASFANLVNYAFRQARKAAGIGRPITPHGLRHRYCTKLAEAGASAFTIAAAARHTDVRTSQRYVSISNRMLLQELDKVFGSRA